LLLLIISLVNADRGRQLVGYFQDWVDVVWWDTTIPGNCAMGCAKPAIFMQKSTPYSQINFGFTFLTQTPNPEQNTCGNSTINCPVWAGEALYAARASAAGSEVVTPTTTIHDFDNSPGLVAISEVFRLSRQGPSGPKRCLISLGGWSDWARVETIDNAQKIAKMAANMVLLSFADGIDLDFEHLAEYNKLDQPDGKNEYDAYNALVQALRQELDGITEEVWVNTAQARYDDLLASRNQAPYYSTNMKYMQEIKQNGVPKFEISWTTRFNAFLNKSNPFNYLLPGSPVPPPFATDNEGVLIYPKSGDCFDSVNIMAYDGGSPAGPLQFNFPTILNNFKVYGQVDPSKINMGFEPGNQYGGGVWEGMTTDQATAKFIKANGYGGAMVWPVNPDPAVEPLAAKWCPVLAAALNQIIEPQWPYGTPPTYSKCDPNTGWNS